MPWETPLQSIATSISGPVAKFIGVLIMVMSGLIIAFGWGDEVTPFGKKTFRVKTTWICKIVFGLSIAFTAASFFLGFLGYHE